MSPSPSSPTAENWLTAEDLLNAAESQEGKFTHSPILLIPYDQDNTPDQDLDLDLQTLPKNIFSTNNFAILDTLSAQLLEEKESNNVAPVLPGQSGLTTQTSKEKEIIPRVGTSSKVSLDTF